MIEVATSLDALLDFYTEHKNLSAPMFAEKLYHLRVSSRKSPSSQAWLNHLYKYRIFELRHHVNPMYIDLLESKLDFRAMEIFLSEYYWGSGYGFQREVINNAYKVTIIPAFKEYLKLILREEQNPRQHYIIFQEYIASLGMKILDRQDASVVFSHKQLRGYNEDICSAFGYALGIEVEADYQISLLSCALSNGYRDSLYDNEFFELHLDFSGEEAHAIETCRAIEQSMKSEADAEKVRSGFDQAITDTGLFLSAIRAMLS
jgi:hypothetical protein